jgi:hypothetical protein
MATLLRCSVSLNRNCLSSDHHLRGSFGALKQTDHMDDLLWIWDAKFRIDSPDSSVFLKTTQR